MRDFVTELENASRGYADRLDTFQPTKVLKRKLEKRENKMSDEGELRLPPFLTQTNDP